MGQSQRKPAAMENEIPFAVSVFKLSGECTKVEGCFGTMRMTELKAKICEELGLFQHETLLCLGGRIFEPEGDEAKQLSELGIGEGAELTTVTCSFLRQLAGSWRPAPSDHSPWMTGMRIAEDGTFVCKSGAITDGQLRLLSMGERRINLKRTCPDANDHVFTVDEDCSRMVGACVQSGCTYTLTTLDVDAADAGSDSGSSD
mmetsp:Transcript_58906/g.117880  ORF Transcript_58906/g.117880 Transcript_58906/m.117880 type:complete len:202 (+) Transcript_58906:48-653(+)